ncbi:MAG TPA: DnaJ domain-containing protein [Candidatus Paceibacterota bacterium]|nr:DnaJ domain-containing protein [Candidatus Paceibacterota bacterium]
MSVFNLRKKSQLNTTVELRTLSGKYGTYQAYCVNGNTIPIKERLKSLGFRWNGKNKVWIISANKYTPYIEKSLKEIGVSTPGSSTIAPSEETVAPSEETNSFPYNTKSDNYINGEWITENKDIQNSYGFPVNENIHSFDAIFKEGENTGNVRVTIDRKAQTKEGYGEYYYKRPPEKKKKPVYVFKFFDIDTKKEITELQVTSTSPFSDENEYLGKTTETIRQVLNQEKRLKRQNFYYKIAFHFDAKNRTEDFKEYIKDEDGSFEGTTIHGFNVDIEYQDENGNYSGTYPLKANIRTSGDKEPYEFSISEDLDFEGKPRKYYFISESLKGIHTIEQFNQKVKKISQTDELKNNYIDYLKSFPFLESQRKQGEEEASQIIGFLSGGNASTDFFLNELKQKGYIRPHRRQKQMGSGLSSGEEIKWVVDSEKIKDDIYGSRYLKETPEFFYAVLAYWIHRRKNNISRGWWDQLSDVINKWVRSMKKFGHEINIIEIDETIARIGNQIFNEIVKRVKTEEPTVEEVELEPSVIDFANFANRYDVDTTNIKDRLKNIFRELSMKLHPDLNQENPNAEEEFKEFGNKWDAIPTRIKGAVFNLKFMKTSFKK